MIKHLTRTLATALVLTSGLHAQELIDYTVSIRVGNEGTDENVVLLMFGETGLSDSHTITGDFDKGAVITKTFSQVPDIGVIGKIRIGSTTSHPFGDDWIVSSVVITRVPGGSSTFLINRRQGQGKVHEYKATSVTMPPVKITKDGRADDASGTLDGDTLTVKMQDKGQEVTMVFKRKAG